MTWTLNASQAILNKLLQAYRVLSPFPPPQPSTIHMACQRVNVFSEILGTVVDNFHPAAILIPKFAQFLNSLHASIRRDSSCTEKIAELLEASLAALQVVLATTLLFMDDKCEDSKSALCTLSYIAAFFYQATLLVAWGPHEASVLYRQARRYSHLRDESQQYTPLTLNSIATQNDYMAIDIGIQSGEEGENEPELLEAQPLTP